jgi:DNA-binding LacI/PurR family transcriptional regulator
VLVARAGRRQPMPGVSERSFLDELAAQGVETSSYNLPHWEETPEGFYKLLTNLFRHTPPTALIIDEIPRFFATVAFLARHRIHVPEQVSLVSTDCDASLDWCHPGIAHMRWDTAPIVRRVVRWVDNVRRGIPDRRVINIPVEFIPGASTGPVRAG